MKLNAVIWVLACTLPLGACAAKKPSTALATVTVLPTEFDMPGLERKRQVRLYLPADYATSGKRYPVLYMHDGQNLFDEATAFSGEWNVDETLARLAAEKKLDLIVVGVDNGQDKRITELNAWNHPKFGEAEGAKYMDFMVKVVKPMIDAQYRTLPDRANTAIMGSSMGGLMSHYAINTYPQVFSKAGVFSPSYWASEGAAFNQIMKQPAAKDARLYMLMGQKEGEMMNGGVQHAYALLKTSGHPQTNMVLKIVPEGEHKESFWSAQFSEAVLWMFAPAPGTTAALAP